MTQLPAFHNEEAGVSLYRVGCIPFREEIARKHTKVDFLSLLKQIPGYKIKQTNQRAGHENLLPRQSGCQMFQKALVLHIFEGTRY